MHGNAMPPGRNPAERTIRRSADDLQAMERRLIGAIKFDIISRTIQFIIECCGYAHYYNPLSSILTLPIGRRDIADYAGISYESLSRALAVLEKRGLIRRVGTGAIRVKSDLLHQQVSLV